MVAGYAAKLLVESGLKPGELHILSADSSIPYERPPLSKVFSPGRTRKRASSLAPTTSTANMGSKSNLTVSRIVWIRAGKQFIALWRGNRIRKARRGDRRASEETEHSRGRSGWCLLFRTLEDSKRIRQKAEGAKRAIVVGGGFIAMEVTSVLA